MTGKKHTNRNIIPSVIPEDVAARFWAKVIPEPNSGCWLWTGAIRHAGYGALVWQRREFIASRLSMTLAGHRPRRDQNVCHRCDNPYCVNPEHLFLGTQMDNIIDMHRKGRAAVGERMPTARLTAAQVHGIRFLWTLGRKQNVMARQYGVGQMTISRIVRRTMWRHVPELPYGGGTNAKAAS